MRFGPVEHLFRTLRFQLTFWNTIAILVLVSAALWGVREGLRWTLLNELDKALAEDAGEVGLIVEGYYPDWEQIGRELKPKVISHSERGWYVRVFSADGKLVWSSKSAPETHVPLVKVIGHGPHNRGTYRMLQRPIPAAGKVPAMVVRVGATRDALDDDVFRAMNDVDFPVARVREGIDAAAAAGPKGRAATGATDVVMRAEILSYSRSRGLFAGVSLEGSTLRPDNRANEKLYGRKLTVKQILRQGKAGAPAPAHELISLLNQHSPKNLSDPKSLK